MVTRYSAEISTAILAGMADFRERRPQSVEQTIGFRVECRDIDNFYYNRRLFDGTMSPHGDNLINESWGDTFAAHFQPMNRRPTPFLSFFNS